MHTQIREHMQHETTANDDRRSHQPNRGEAQQAGAGGAATTDRRLQHVGAPPGDQKNLETHGCR